MGRKTVRFKCVHCGHCCRDVVALPTPWDVVQIVRETGADPYEFLEFLSPDEVLDVEKSDPTWLKCGGKRYLMALRRGKKGCYFLNKKNRQCTIYETRPMLCRLYPFKLQETRDGQFKGFTLHHDVECPRKRDGVVETKPLYDLYLKDDRHQDDYARLVKFFNRQKNKKKKPRHFIKLFYERR